MNEKELEELFYEEHRMFHQDWFVSMKRQILLNPNANESRMFQEWVILRLAATSAALKRLLVESKELQK